MSVKPSPAVASCVVSMGTRPCQADTVLVLGGTWRSRDPRTGSHYCAVPAECSWLLPTALPSPAAHPLQSWPVDTDPGGWEIELKRTKRLCWVHNGTIVSTRGSQFPFCPQPAQMPWRAGVGRRGSPPRVLPAVPEKVREEAQPRSTLVCVGVSLLCR